MAWYRLWTSTGQSCVVKDSRTQMPRSFAESWDSSTDETSRRGPLGRFTADTPDLTSRVTGTRALFWIVNMTS